MKSVASKPPTGGFSMTDNVLATLSCATDNPDRTTRAVFFAMMAHKEGKNVNLSIYTFCDIIFFQPLSPLTTVIANDG
jgi:hypothetical protein